MNQHTKRNLLLASVIATAVAVFIGCVAVVSIAFGVLDRLGLAGSSTEHESVEASRAPFTDELTYDETFTLLDMAWNESDGQDNLCWGYTTMGSDWAWDALASGGSGIEYDRDAFDDFFTERCSS